MRRLFLAGTLVLAIATQALPYGAEGHKAIAQAAQGKLNPTALAAVQKLLGTNVSLADIAT